MAHDHRPRPEIDEERLELIGVGNLAEARIAGEAAIGCEAARRGELPEAERQRGRGQRLAGTCLALEDRRRPVGGIADQRPALRETPAQHVDQRLADHRQHVDVVMAVDEVRRNAGNRLEPVELPFDLAGDLVAVDGAADRAADDLVG